MYPHAPPIMSIHGVPNDYTQFSLVKSECNHNFVSAISFQNSHICINKTQPLLGTVGLLGFAVAQTSCVELIFQFPLVVFGQCPGFASILNS